MKNKPDDTLLASTIQAAQEWQRRRQVEMRTISEPSIVRDVDVLRRAYDIGAQLEESYANQIRMTEMIRTSLAMPGSISWVDDLAYIPGQMSSRFPNMPEPKPEPDTRSAVEKRFSGLIWDDEK
jgi:hypothetical protein